MPNTLTTVLIEQVVPAVERLKLDSLVLCDEAGKKAVSSYPPGRLTRREAALLDGEDLPGQIYKYEGHPILELAIAVRGRAELALGGHRYVMSEGDVAIVTPNVLHLERLANRNQGYHLLWLRVSPDRLAMHMSSYSQGNRFQLVRGGSIPRSGAIGRCFEAASEEVDSRQNLWLTIVRAKLCEGFALAIRYFETHGLGQNPEEAREGAVDIAKSFIQSHFSEDLSLNRIAGEVFLSPNYFSSLFSQVAGQTIFEYIHDVRIDEAKRLLAETNLPVRQLARRVGIPSASYFCRLFRKAVGMAPQDFRLQAQPGTQA
jgi:AraC-like DNA-binding protein